MNKRVSMTLNKKQCAALKDMGGVVALKRIISESINGNLIVFKKAR